MKKLIDFWDIRPNSYEIHSNGQVYSRIRKRFLTRFKHEAGYLIVHILLKSGRNRFFRIHRLLAKAFIENPENKDCINHKNGVRDDNRISNLEWCSFSENSYAKKKIRKGYKGIIVETRNSKTTKNKYFRARIRYKSKTISLGYFKKPIDAAKAYDIAAKKYHGNFAVINNV